MLPEQCPVARIRNSKLIVPKTTAMTLSNADLLLLCILIIGTWLLNKDYIREEWLSSKDTKKGYPPGQTDNQSS